MHVCSVHMHTFWLYMWIYNPIYHNSNSCATTCTVIATFHIDGIGENRVDYKFNSTLKAKHEHIYKHIESWKNRICDWKIFSSSFFAILCSRWKRKNGNWLNFWIFCFLSWKACKIMVYLEMEIIILLSAWCYCSVPSVRLLMAPTRNNDSEPTTIIYYKNKIQLKNKIILARTMHAYSIYNHFSYIRFTYVVV